MAPLDSHTRPETARWALPSRVLAASACCALLALAGAEAALPTPASSTVTATVGAVVGVAIGADGSVSGSSSTVPVSVAHEHGPDFHVITITAGARARPTD